jgi:tungstate transport system permease protein
MDLLLDSLRAALDLILSRDPDIWDAVRTSLGVSARSTLAASAMGVPAGLLLGLYEGPGKRTAVVVLNSLMALPTVLVGLLVFGFIGRQGPLGSLGLLFTPAGIVIGGSILASPIVANYTLAAVKGSDPRIVATARTLGAGPLRCLLALAAEIRFGIVAAVVAGFGRVISEVGVAMMLGGNIRGYTRTMTTAIALETSKGEFALGLGLGLVLMAVALGANLIFGFLQQK